MLGRNCVAPTALRIFLANFPTASAVGWLMPRLPSILLPAGSESKTALLWRD
jgi:hypothetical protein